MVSPKNPTKYVGPDVYLANIVTRNRKPTGADYRQPETGKNYVIFTGWQVGKDPSDGVEGDLFLLSKIVANVAYWVKISSGTPSGAVLGVTVDADTTPGTDPVRPDSEGLIIVTGAQVAAGTTPNVIRTDSLAANTYTIEIQRSQAVASTTIGDNGVSHFDSSQFAVDGNGFVTFPGKQGTFVPTLTFGGASSGVTYAVAEGIYTVVANMVFFAIYMDVSSKGVSTGDAAIGNLPFTVAGNSSQVVQLQIDDATFSANYYESFGRPITSGTTIQIWETGTGVSSHVMQDTQFAAAPAIRCQGFYYK